MKAVGLAENPHTACKYLGVGKQQLVEIAKALSKNVKLLIMDEPTAALNDKDSDALLNLILKLREERGISVIIISYKLDELLKVADRITVLRDGETIETLENDESISRSHTIRSMVGREMSNLYPERTVNQGGLAMEVKDWCVFSPSVAGERMIDHVSFRLHYGEVVGIAGLMGAGRTELALSLFGRAYGVNISGEIYKDGHPLRLHTVKDAISHRIAYIPEDRKDAGLLLEEDIVTNISLSNLEKFSSRGVMNRAAEVDASQAFRKTIRIKATSVFQKTRMLNGGNQQKGDVCVGAVVDEETGGMGTLDFMDRGHRADVCIMTEATRQIIAPLCRGILWGNIIVEGRSGHIELPQKDWRDGGTVDAIRKARLIMDAIDHLNEDWAKKKVHPLLKIPNQIIIGQINAGEWHSTFANKADMAFDIQYLPYERDAVGGGSLVMKEFEDFIYAVA